MLKKLKQWFVLPYKAWLLLAVIIGTGLASIFSDYTYQVPFSMLMYFTLGEMVVGALIALIGIRLWLRRKVGMKVAVALADGDDD